MILNESTVIRKELVQPNELLVNVKGYDMYTAENV